jgi:hypothetical protein
LENVFSQEHVRAPRSQDAASLIHTKEKFDMNATLDQMYEELAAGVEAFNATQDNPLNLPSGFHHAVSARGESVGLGYYCPKCKIHFPSHAPDQVKHCGTVSAKPTRFFARRKLKTYRLRGF